MANAHMGDITDYRDLETLNHHRTVLDSGQVTEAEIMVGIARTGRDNARTPMRWEATENAGFTTGEPWIGANPNHREINAEVAVADEGSIFPHYRRLTALRKEHPVIVHGRYTPLPEEDPAAFARTRTPDGQVLLVLANWSGDQVAVESVEESAGHAPELLLGTHPEPTGPSTPLRPRESRAYLGSTRP